MAPAGSTMLQRRGGAMSAEIELFIRVGETVYGPNWKGALAHDMGVRTSSVQQWANGKYRLRPEIWAMVRDVLQRRHGALAELLALIAGRAEASQDAAAEALEGR